MRSPWQKILLVATRYSCPRPVFIATVANHAYRSGFALKCCQISHLQDNLLSLIIKFDTCSESFVSLSLIKWTDLQKPSYQLKLSQIETCLSILPSRKLGSKSFLPSLELTDRQNYELEINIYKEMFLRYREENGKRIRGRHIKEGIKCGRDMTCGHDMTIWHQL